MVTTIASYYKSPIANLEQEQEIAKKILGIVNSGDYFATGIDLEALAAKVAGRNWAKANNKDKTIAVVRALQEAGKVKIEDTRGRFGSIGQVIVKKA